MNTFNDAITPWVADCHCDWLYPIAFQQLLELLFGKFSAIVIENSGRSGVSAKPLTVKEDGDVITGFVFDGKEFWPAWSFVNDCQGLNFFN